MSLPDLVIDSKLEAEVHRGWVRHTYRRRGKSGKDRKVDVSETWVRQTRLGTGSFGTVWLERCQEPASEVGPQVRAVKEIRRDTRGPKVDYSRELLAIAKFSLPKYVPCFVQSYGWFETPQAIYIAMEYLQHGDLKKHLFRPLPESEARTICTQVLEGLKHMHENGFVHRDLKPQNILVVSPGPDWLVQISDFGISRRLEEDGTVTMRQGTLGFMAPEMLGFIPRGSSPYAVDIWSLGALLFFVLTNTIFLKDLHRLRNFANGTLTAADFDMNTLRSQGVSNECSEFLRGLLAPSPEDRPSSQAASGHRWLAVSRVAETQGTPSARRPEESVGTEASDFVATAPWTEASATWSSTLPKKPEQRPASSPEQNPETIDDTVRVGENFEPPKSTGKPISGLLASVNRYGKVKVWDLATGRCQRTFYCFSTACTLAISAAAFSPDLRTVALSYEKSSFLSVGERLRLIVGSCPWKNVETWDMTTGRRRRVLKGHPNRVDTVAFSADSRRVASRSVDGVVKIWDAASGKRLDNFHARRGALTSVAFSTDLTKVVTSSRGVIIGEDQGSWWCQVPEVSMTGESPDPVGKLALSADSRLVASAMSDDSIGIYELGDTKAWHLQSLEGHPRVSLVAFSPDSKLLASASEDGTIKLWQLAASTCTQTLKGHTRTVKSIVFRPDSELMASASEDGTIKIWDLQTSECLQTLGAVDFMREQIVSVAFSPDLG